MIASLTILVSILAMDLIVQHTHIHISLIVVTLYVIMSLLMSVTSPLSLSLLEDIMDDMIT